MDVSQTKMPRLSLVVPSSSQNPSHVVVGPSDKILSRTPNQNDSIVPAKQKRLFPVACRLVPMDQWFTTRIDRTWNVLDLKIWLLSKALPTSVLPLPASYRPSSPVTFAAAPPQPPYPPTVTSYHTAAPSTTLISPITFAAAPHPHQSTSSSHDSPQTSGRQVFYPPLFSAVETSSSLVSSPTVPSPSSSAHLSQDGEDVPLYANSYGAMINNDFEDDDEDDGDKVVQIAPRSIPYSYNTGAPAISGLAALKSNSSNILSGRGYSASLSGLNVDLVRQAAAIAKRWRVYSFSTGMLLSDDLPLAEYTIRPYELLELHRTGAYVSLPRTIFPDVHPYSFSDDHDVSNPPAPSTKTVAYPSTTTRHFNAHPSTPTRQSLSHHTDGRDPTGSESSDDEYDDMVAGSPYAQPYFDGWVWVLRDGASGSNGNCEPGTNDVGDGDGLPGRKMRRRGRAKSETAKSGKGKDRSRLEREWNDMKQPQWREGDPAVEVPESTERWNKRWLIIREGIMTVWKERDDELPEERYKIAACAGLYGADRLQSVLASASQSHTPFATHLVGTPNPHISTSSSKTSSNSLPPPHHIICARFRHRSSSRGTDAGRMEGKFAGKSHQRVGSWVVLKVADAAIHEHLLRIFHRLSYSSPPSSDHPAPVSFSVAPSRPLHTRTLRTDFVPNPIPHPISLSFSPPSPIQQGDESPLSSFDDLGPSDGSEYDDGWVDTRPVWGRSRRKPVGKCVTGYVGLGRGVGVRYPEWREEIIHKAIQAGRGVTLPQSLRDPDLSSQAKTPQTDLPHMSGSQEGLNDYGVDLAPDDHYSDDSDSDAFSEEEWDGWAYDLDRPKIVDEIGTGPRRTRQPSRDSLSTPQESPVSDPELAAAPSSALDDRTSFHSTTTPRPRARSFSENDNSSNSLVCPDVYTPSLSPTTPSPTTSNTRVRASTISAHPHNSSTTVVETTRVGFTQLAPSALSQVDHDIHPVVTATLRPVEPNTPGGVRNMMRGLSIRAGKESFLRGLENALDFVEGK